MADRTKAAPGALSVALTIYGLAYVIVCLLAGPHPPSFLFDAIPSGLGRQVAGFLLWIHVAVRYEKNVNSSYLYHCHIIQMHIMLMCFIAV